MEQTARDLDADAGPHAEGLRRAMALVVSRISWAEDRVVIGVKGL